MYQYSGGKSYDDRGTVSFVNGFNPYGLAIRRFYMVENFDTNTVRAWHAHKHEDKWVTCISGAAIIGYAHYIDDFVSPKQMDAKRYYISAERPEVLYLPAGGANGSRMLVPGTKLLYFSSQSLEMAANDDYRIDWNFIPDFWETENR